MRTLVQRETSSAVTELRSIQRHCAPCVVMDLNGLAELFDPLQLYLDR